MDGHEQSSRATVMTDLEEGTSKRGFVTVFGIQIVQTKYFSKYVHYLFLPFLY